jgi:hypothetical protein
MNAKFGDISAGGSTSLFDYMGSSWATYTPATPPCEGTWPRKLHKPLTIAVYVAQNTHFSRLLQKTPTLHVVGCTEVQIKD